MLAEQGLSAGDLLDKECDILFKISRSTFRPRSGQYDPVQQLLIDIRPHSVNPELTGQIQT